MNKGYLYLVLLFSLLRFRKIHGKLLQTQTGVAFKSSVLDYSYSHVLDCTQPAAQSVQDVVALKWHKAGLQLSVNTVDKGGTSDRCVRLLQCHIFLSVEREINGEKERVSNIVYST